MEKEDIYIDDWDRIFFGEGTPVYLLEVIVRVAVVYIILLIAMRFMGKRLIAGVGRADVVARVFLAAAVGLPIQRPGRGLLVALVLVIIIVGVGRILAWLSVRNKHFEKNFQGIYAPLVIDGIINIERLHAIQITRDELFGALREEDIRHLGEVERLYMEANGKFSLFKKEKPGPGLSVIPDWDPELRKRQLKADIVLCNTCGHSPEENMKGACVKCGGSKRENAVMPKKQTAKS